MKFILGKKICLHVHGVFPYIYIPYDGSETADSIMYQIATAIDKSLNVLLGQSSSNTQHIYKIALVSGRLKSSLFSVFLCSFSFN